MSIKSILQSTVISFIIPGIFFCSIMISNTAYAKTAFGVISGKVTVEIGAKISKCKFPVPSSTVHAYRLYSPGYSAASVVPASGKYKLKVPPGPYAVLFDIWSSSGMPVKMDPIFVWVKPGEAYTEEESPNQISVAQTVLTNLYDNPYTIGTDLYDYTGFLTAFLIIDSQKNNKLLLVMEDSTLDSYAEILALIDANSAPEIPEAQRLNKALALAHIEPSDTAFQLQAEMKAASLPTGVKSESAIPLQTDITISDPSQEGDDKTVANDDSDINTKSAFDKAVDKNLKKLLKSLIDKINSLPLPAKIILNFQGERIFDAWEKGRLGTAKETWEVGPIVLKRDYTLDRSSDSNKSYYGGYSIDTSTSLSSCTWNIVGQGSVQYSGDLFEPTNLEGDSVIQFLLERVNEGSTSQGYFLGGEIFEKKEIKFHVYDPSTHASFDYPYNPPLSVTGQGRTAPAGGSISVNTTYEKFESTTISTLNTKWSYQLMTP